MTMDDAVDFEEDDDFLPESSETTTEPPAGQAEDDLTSEVLKLRGISDPNKIKFEDESGAIVERPWDQLSRAEQINILADQTPEDTALDSSEVNLINAIRQSGLTTEQYIQQLREPQPAPVRYTAEDLSDDELYALDLLNKAGSDITDEEITDAIENAKQNETLYAKTVEGLRNEYIRLQQEEDAKLQNEQAAQRKAYYDNFANNIRGQIVNLNSMAGQPMQLSNEDMDELSSFMLDLDGNGMSSFGRALNDPALFTRAAFWLLNEDKIAAELNSQIQENYRRGYEQAKKDMQGTSKLVFNNPTSQQKTATDAFIDDEDW